MAPEPDDRWWPGGGDEPPRVAGPHAHVWQTTRRPGSPLEVEVCIRCHDIQWDKLDGQVKLLLARFSEQLGQKLKEVLADGPVTDGDT